MPNFLKISLMMLCVIFIAACDNKQSTEYLMSHPQEVKKQLAECEAQLNKSQSEATRCENILAIASQLAEIIQEQQEDPEKFGQKILDTEMEREKARGAMQAAQAELLTLQASGEPEAKAAAEAKLKEAQQKYNDLAQKVRVFLAIVALSPPE